MSSGPGLATLLDGASAQVVGSVRVAETGARLAAVQAGASAYVTDFSRGGVVRIDGATYERTPSVQFTGGTSDALQVLPADAAVYVVDGRRALAARADPVTLRLLEDAVPLSARPGTDQAVVDEGGALWVVDGGSGSLSRLGGSGRSLREGTSVARQAVPSATRLVALEGAPLLVHPDGTLAEVGEEPKDVRPLPCRLELREDEQPRLAAAGEDMLAAAISERGAVLIAALGAGKDCQRVVQVGQPGDTLGAPVESAGMLFVPNATRGRATVIDLRSGQLVADIDVAGAGSSLELLATNGAIFYNDPGSEKAGVLRFDGRAWQATPTPKYDPGRPHGQLLPADPGRPHDDRSPPEVSPPRTDQPAGSDEPDAGGAGTGDDGSTNGGGGGGGGGGSGGGSGGGTHTADGQVALRLNVREAGAVSITVQPAATVDPAVCRDLVPPADPGAGLPDCRYVLPVGSRVTLEAEADRLWAVGSWSGCEGNPAPGGSPPVRVSTCTLTLDAAAGDRDVEVAFVFTDDTGGDDRATLILDPSDNGTATAPYKGDPAASCAAPGCRYDAADPVTVTAVPADPARFYPTWSEWTGCAARELTCSVELLRSDSLTVEVTFKPYRTVTVILSGPGTGIVKGSNFEGDWSCESGCEKKYLSDIDATFTIEATGGSRLSRYDRGHCSESPCVVATNLDPVIGVAFERPDATPPDPTVSAFGTTATGATPAEVERTRQDFSVTARGSDAQSPVTSMRISASASYTCSSGGDDPLLQNRSALTSPGEAVPGAEATYAVRAADFRCGGDYPIFVFARATFTATAVSGGGERRTRTLSVSLRP